MASESLGGRVVGSPWRWAGAALAAVATMAHVPVVADHWAHAPYMGVLFVLYIAIGLALATMFLYADTPTVWRATAAVSLSAIATFLLSRTVGLPQLSAEVGRWHEPLAWIALSSELALALLAIGVLAASSAAAATNVTGGGHTPRSAWVPAVLAVATLVVGTTGTAFAAQSSEKTEATGSAAAAGSATDQSMAGHSMSGAASGSAAYWSAVQGAYHPTKTVRTYYIAADEILWDYTPDGKNDITGQPFSDQDRTWVGSGPDRIGTKYLKCLYRGYTDATFATLTQRPTSEAYLGFTGPVIRGAVGDTIKVVFKNNCSIPASVHPHGVFYQKASEGAPYADNTSGQDKLDDAVTTGSTHTSTWLVPDRAGPGPSDGSSVMWMYHSHTDEVADTYAGLQGFMVITAANMAKPDGSPKDVDREVFELFAVMNENESPLLGKNTKRLPGRKIEEGDEDFAESNLMHSINGYLFGNQPMVTLKKGERVRWYLMSMGTEVDLHTPHWHGNDVVTMGMRMDVVSLLPAGMITADMVPDNPGIWLFHCHVNDHLTAGMVTRFQVTN